MLKVQKVESLFQGDLSQNKSSVAAKTTPISFQTLEGKLEGYMEQYLRPPLPPGTKFYYRASDL